jgi:hypothetical protein
MSEKAIEHVCGSKDTLKFKRLTDEFTKNKK